jgi:alkylhydroperoxidase family enzyme
LSDQQAKPSGPAPGIPRLEFADLPPDLAELLRPRVERLGYLGEFFRCAAHQPAALVDFYRFTEDLKHALPDRLTELVALTASSVMDNPYERHQHERLSLKLGFGEPWIRDVLARRASDETERAVQALVLAVIERRGHGTGAELDEVVRRLGPAAAIAVLLLIGRYVTHALFVNALGLAPPVPSPLAGFGPQAAGPGRAPGPKPKA